MTTKINDRIMQIIEAEGLNKRTFSLKIGVSSAVMQNILGSRQSKPSYELIVKILLSFEHINPGWLLLGRGEMFTKTQKDYILEEPTKHYAASSKKLKDRIQHVNDTLQELSREVAAINKALD